jgi:hypothetical protein
MVSKIINNTENVFFAILDLIKKIIKGLIISFILIIFGMFIDVCFGYSWRSNFIVPLIILFIPIYPMINKFSHTNIFYVLGWVSGIFVFSNFGLLTTLQIKLYIIVPIIIFIINFIWHKIILKK